VVQLLPARRRVLLCTGPATIDLDGTDVECYGSRKDGIAYSYKGARAGRAHVATWAEAGVVVAADLLAGDEDPRPGAADLICGAAATLRAAGVTCRPRVRGDVGYFAAPIAWAAVAEGCDFSLGVTRNQAVWRTLATIPDKAWRKAKRMRGAQVAVADYAPAGWPPDTRCVVRRVKLAAADISADPRSRRRRTIPKGQLTLALEGLSEHAYAYSFIVTNLDVTTPAKAVKLEAWHRMRTDIEDRFRDAKHGAALRHLPSGDHTVNTVWMWAALLAINLSAWLQELSGLDDGRGRHRVHLGTLRHRLLLVPARLVRHVFRATGRGTICAKDSQVQRARVLICRRLPQPSLRYKEQTRLHLSASAIALHLTHQTRNEQDSAGAQRAMIGSRKGRVLRSETKAVTGVDDHSRYGVMAKVVARVTGRAVCLAFVEALPRFGVPEQVLRQWQAVHPPVRQSGCGGGSRRRNTASVRDCKYLTRWFPPCGCGCGMEAVWMRLGR